MRKRVPFHFFAFPFTKRFLFCFKELNNFQSGRKVEKRTKIRVENVVHVVKSCNGFIFKLFHEPLVKHLQDSQKKSELNLDLVFLGWDEDRIFTFSDENDQNASRRGISLPNGFWKSIKVPSEHHFRPFSRNTTRTHSFFTLAETLGDPKSVSYTHLTLPTIYSV